MKDDDIIVERSYAFAVRIINCYKYITANKSEFVLSKRLLRCGTSVGANVEKAMGSYSGEDFRAKLSVAYKEAKESRYWLRLLSETDFLEKRVTDSLLADCDELLKSMDNIIKCIKYQES